MLKVPAIILAGGLGTRLRSIDTQRPKPMVLVHNKPFLHWLIKHLESAGYKDFIISTGYKARLLEEYHWKKEFPECIFSFHREPQPLGTGGAVQAIFKTFPELNGAWIFNGDTLLNQPLLPIVPKDSVHYTCLEPSEIFDAKPNLKTEDDRVIAVGVIKGAHLFDGGQVFVTRSAVEQYEGPIPCALHDLIKKSIDSRGAGYTVTRGTCYDIGTPERLHRFEKYINKISSK